MKASGTNNLACRKPVTGTAFAIFKLFFTLNNCQDLSMLDMFC